VRCDVAAAGHRGHGGQPHISGASDRGHVESYFLKLNDADGRRALWIKATILIRHGGTPRVAEAWAVAFDRGGGGGGRDGGDDSTNRESRHVAVKQTVPLARARFFGERGGGGGDGGGGGLDLQVANLAISAGRVHGQVESETNGHRIEIDLSFTMDAPPLVPLPHEKMYSGPLPSSKLVSPHPDARFFGSYTVDDGESRETIEVDGWRGMQGHNWGTKHAELYAWSHCNQWEGHQADDLVLEGVTARVKVGPVLVPPLTIICIQYRGVRYNFNAPLALLRARGAIADDARRWTFGAKSALATVTGELWADTLSFVGLTYENPDGAITHCLNSKIARGRIRLSIKGRRDVEAMTRAAALEIGTKDPNHGVKMFV
jgi:hypothetical protein